MRQNVLTHVNGLVLSEVELAAQQAKFHAFTQMHELGIIDVRLVPQTGCEAFARLIFEGVNRWLVGKELASRVRLRRVEVREHGANSAMLEAPPCP